MRYISNDVWEMRKWKKAIAFELAKKAKQLVTIMKAEWTFSKLAALKTAVIIKQGFHNEYREIKKTMPNNGSTLNPIDPLNLMNRTEKPKISPKLQELMRKMICTHSFQNDCLENDYKELRTKLQLKEEDKKAQETLVNIPIDPAKDLKSPRNKKNRTST